MRAFLGHAIVNRERTKEREQDENQVAIGESAPAARKAIPG